MIVEVVNKRTYFAQTQNFKAIEKKTKIALIEKQFTLSLETWY